MAGSGAAGNGATAAGAPKAGAVEAGLAAAAKYQTTNRFAEATAILSKLTEQAPTDQRVRMALAQALLGERSFSKAYEQYEAAISLDGSSSGGVQAVIAQNPKLAQLHAEAGTCAMMVANSAATAENGAASAPTVGIGRAIEHYSMAQTLDPTNARYPLFLAMAQMKGGTAESDSAAMASLVRASVLQPDLAEAWGTMGELELKRNRADLAAQHVDKAIKLQPEQPKWRVVRARIFNRQGEPEVALSTLAGLDEATRNSEGVLRLRGESYGLLKKPLDAAIMYEHAANMSASASKTADPELWYRAALWYQRGGDLGKAKGAAEMAAMLGHAPARDLSRNLGGTDGAAGSSADGSPR